VSRFHVGDEAPARRIEPAPIAPIQVRPSQAALPPAHARGLNGASRRPAAHAGQWEEF
jgi:hypothetical protein